MTAEKFLPKRIRHWLFVHRLGKMPKPIHHKPVTMVHGSLVDGSDGWLPKESIRVTKYEPAITMYGVEIAPPQMTVERNFDAT